MLGHLKKDEESRLGTQVDRSISVSTYYYAWMGIEGKPAIKAG